MRIVFSAALVVTVLGACTGSDPVLSSPGGATTSDAGGTDGAATAGTLPIIVQPVALTAAPLRSFDSVVTIARNGVIGPIHLSVIDAPTGVTVGEANVPDGSSTVVLTATGTSDVKQARQKVTLRAEANGASLTQSVDLIVRGHPGDLDQTANGTGIFPIDFAGDDGSSVSMTTDRLGRILLLGVNKCTMFRRLPSGTADDTFKPASLTPTSAPLNQLPFMSAATGCVTLSSSGDSIIVAGETFDTSSVFHGWIVRLTLDGAVVADRPLYTTALTPSLPSAVLADGTGGFRVVFENAASKPDQHSLELVGSDLAPGRTTTISAATNGPTYWAFGSSGVARGVAATTTDGKMSLGGFDATGTALYGATFPGSAVAGTPSGVALMSDGTALGVGYNTSNGSTFAVSLDTSGNNFRIPVTLSESGAQFQEVAVGAGDAMVMAGTESSFPFVARYNATGTIDSTFGDKGIARLRDQTATAAVDGIVLQDDGIVFLTRATTGKWNLFRLWL